MKIDELHVGCGSLVIGSDFPCTCDHTPGCVTPPVTV
jgi:hypothetical protein